jgi:hypothetical protein
VDDDLRHLARQLAALHAKAPSSFDIRAEGSRDAKSDAAERTASIRFARCGERSLTTISLARSKSSRSTFGRETLFRGRAGGVFGEPITRDQVALIPVASLSGAAALGRAVTRARPAAVAPVLACRPDQLGSS